MIGLTTPQIPHKDIKGNVLNKIPDNYIVTSADSWDTGGNPNKILGINKDLNKK